MNTYKTITSNSEGIYKEKGSKFLSYAIPVSDKEEINQILKQFRIKYFDARHICYAWMLGFERTEFRVNDNGEPSGTAGRPILGQINSNELTNILVIVVRYFGGVLLGTSGLATAYKQASQDAINNAEIVEKTVDITINIHFDYLLINVVMRIVKENNASILKQEFNNQCKLTISIPKDNENEIKTKLNKLIGILID